MYTFILIAVLISGNSHPVSIVAEFSSKDKCEQAAERIRSKAKSVDFITCEAK